ncbi:D-2-hydroxyacid dehydrogenase [Phytohabitans kaempferiae]|uniref:D-2-hydroxyacid dehydrogenase n=1 Tax=Phytohabitans kaempferiae TaxID=1620943 RepID=A0ABV6LW58_9ACTN
MTVATEVLLAYAGHFRLDPADVAELRHRFPGVRFAEAEVSAIGPTDVDTVDVIMGTPPAGLLGGGRLRWLQLPSVGLDGRRFPDGLLVTNARGVFAIPAAEHAVALTLALCRRIDVHVRQARDRVWRRNDACLELTGSTVLVVGLGDIGTAVAERFHGLGCTVVGIRRRLDQPLPPHVSAVVPPDQLVSAVAGADVVVLALPHTPRTAGLFDRAAVAALRPRALLVNVGRGAVLDEPALIERLAAGTIAGAGLDVSAEEPPPPSSPLWTLDNVILTSHSVGVSPHRSRRRRELFADNLDRFLAGRPLRNVVDPARGY